MYVLPRAFVPSSKEYCEIGIHCNEGYDWDGRLAYLGRIVGLKGYSRLVEVNSTFYSYPRDSTLRAWRSQVHPEFVFTVKAHQDITHRLKYALVPETHNLCSKMTHACEILSAEAIVFQYPLSIGLDNVFRGNFKDFLSLRVQPHVAIELEVGNLGSTI